MGAFQFVVLATLRAGQLIRGCQPRVEGGHKAIVTAQIEVADGKVLQLFAVPEVVGEPATMGSAPVDEPVALVRSA